MTFLTDLKSVISEAYTGVKAAYTWGMQNKPFVVMVLGLITAGCAAHGIPVPWYVVGFEMALGTGAVGSHIKQNA